MNNDKQNDLTKTSKKSITDVVVGKIEKDIEETLLKRQKQGNGKERYIDKEREIILNNMKTRIGMIENTNIKEVGILNEICTEINCDIKSTKNRMAMDSPIARIYFSIAVPFAIVFSGGYDIWKNNPIPTSLFCTVIGASFISHFERKDQRKIYTKEIELSIIEEIIKKHQNK